MKPSKPCINNRSHYQPSDKQLQLRGHFDEVACSFKQVNKNGRPALSADITVPIATAAQPHNNIPTLSHYAEELSGRLTLLEVSVRQDDESHSYYSFVLHGDFYSEINADSLSSFLSRITHDLQIVLIYAQTHGLELQPAHQSLTTTA